MQADVYRKLQEHLDQLPIGFPRTESGSDLRLLQKIFTEDQAQLAVFLGFQFKPLDTIIHEVQAAGLPYSPEEIERILDEAVSHGALHIQKEGVSKSYANAMLLVGMYEMQIGRLTREFFEVFDAYSEEAFIGEMMRTGIPQFRVIPVEESLTPELHVATYDHLIQIVEGLKEPFAVMPCICKSKRDLFNEPCKQTEMRDTCFAFQPEFTQQIIDQGWGKAISKQELLDKLRKCEAEGLILQPGNAQDPGFVCACCGCCCGFLREYKKLPRPADIITSNFQASINPEECTGCETCVMGCQMEAIVLENDIARVDDGRCIGCGLCVPTCPSGAISLQPKKYHTTPVEDWDALYAKIGTTREKMIKRELRRKARAQKRKWMGVILIGDFRPPLSFYIALSISPI